MIISILFILISCSQSSFSGELDSLNAIAGWTQNGYEIKQNLKIGKIDYMEVIADGTKLFTADGSNRFRIWDLKSGKIYWMARVNYALPMCIHNDSLIYFRNSDQKKPELLSYSIPKDLITATYLGFFKDHNYYKLQTIDTVLICSEIEYINQDPIYIYKSKSTCYSLSSLNLLPVHPYLEQSVNYMFKGDSIYASDYYFYVNDVAYFHNTYENHFSLYAKGKIQELKYKFYENDNTRYKCFNNNNTKFYGIVSNTLVMYDINNDSLMFNGEIKHVVRNIAVDKNSYIVGLNFDGNKIIGLNTLKMQFVNLPLSDSGRYNALSMINNGSMAVITSPLGYIMKINTDTINKMNFIEDFTVSKKHIFENQEVHFDCTVAPTVKDIVWDFGDGTQSHDYSPVHIYASPGNYTVKLTAIFNNETLSLTKPNFINVDMMIYPEIFQDTYYGSAPLTVKVKALPDIQFDSLVWDFGDGTFIHNARETKHDFLLPGVNKFKVTYFIQRQKYEVWSYVRVYDDTMNDYIKIQEDKYLWGGSYYTLSYYSMAGYLGSGRNHFFPCIYYYDSETIGANTFVTEKYYVTKYNPYFNKVTFKETSYRPQLNNYLLGGLIIHQNRDTCFVYDRNASYLFNKVGLKQMALTPANANELYVLTDSGINIYNALLDSIRFINLNSITGANNLKSKTYITNIKDFSTQTNFVLVKLNSNGEIWFGRFDDKFNLSYNTIINAIDFNQLIGNNRNELLLIDKLGNCIALDSNANVKFSKTNELFKTCFVYNGEYLLGYDIQDRSCKFTFYDFDGTLLLEYNIPDFIDSYHRFLHFSGIHQSQDNSIVLTIVEEGDWLSVKILHIYFPVDITVPVPYQENVVFTYPNPSDNYVSIPIPAGKFISLDLYDIMGNRIDPDYEVIPSAGEDIIGLDISLLPIGAWYFRVNCTDNPLFGNFQKTK